MVLLSCGEDDDSPTTITFRDKTEQQAADKDSLLGYLTTHYYNSSFFEAGANHKYTDITITKLPQDADGDYLAMPDPDDNTLLIDAIETIEVEFLEVDYEYYILRINQGGGENPKFTDAIRVRYEGSNVQSETVFESISTPQDLLLQGNGFNTFGTIKAWQYVMPTFNSAVVPSGGYSIVNGVVQYENFGLGVMFIPSGLAYFAASRPNIPAYSNLIFKFELLQHEEMDHDNDGVPSYVEDYNNNEDILDDDTDGDGLPDFIDTDDDGDGVGTIFEDMDSDGDPTNDDTDGDGIPNYLDEDSSESNQEDEG